MKTTRTSRTKHKKKTFVALGDPFPGLKCVSHRATFEIITGETTIELNVCMMSDDTVCSISRYHKKLVAP